MSCWRAATTCTAPSSSSAAASSGWEFATFYNDLGCEVTVLEGMNRLLPTLDRELGQNLGLILKKRGVKVITGATVEGVEQAKDGLTVRFATKRAPTLSPAKKSALRHLPQGLLGRSLRRRLHPRERREAPPGGRSLPDLPPHVYAIGDVSSQVQLAHMASAQGTAVAELLCGSGAT